MRNAEFGPTEISTPSDRCSFRILTQPMSSHKFLSAFNVFLSCALDSCSSCCLLQCGPKSVAAGTRSSFGLQHSAGTHWFTLLPHDVATSMAYCGAGVGFEGACPIWLQISSNGNFYEQNKVETSIVFINYSTIIIINPYYNFIINAWNNYISNKALLQ